ncbi:hypothetical protein KIN20_028817 [Parelaphostrongylus tenuis]|uniref:Uncharacterized protein n=1 Tax=Parelaphostrongylus tenuis TaxID=148309 RepID=A0AAD5WF41_PARTN|nr:hypothetical protein KIN20_028817 [Parelaphostrongylus tenuis]
MAFILSHIMQTLLISSLKSNMEHGKYNTWLAIIAVLQKEAAAFNVASSFSSLNNSSVRSPALKCS